jgi:glycosyltransferase involved in cell wall biosynthesis
MSAAEVLLLPSYAEGSARVVFEGLACGCYVVTTPNSGTIVEDGVHGALIAPGNADELAGAIVAAAADRERVAEVGNRNAALVRAQHRQENYGERLSALYAQIANERKPTWASV